MSVSVFRCVLETYVVVFLSAVQRLMTTSLHNLYKKTISLFSRPLTGQLPIVCGLTAAQLSF